MIYMLVVLVVYLEVLIELYKYMLGSLGVLDFDPRNFFHNFFYHFLYV